MLAGILKKIRNFFLGKPKSISDNNPAKKKFLIKKGKTSKFKIIREKKVIAKKKSRLNILNQSIPKKCPRCKSTGTISKNTKIEGWECNTEKGGCGYKW